MSEPSPFVWVDQDRATNGHVGDMYCFKTAHHSCVRIYRVGDRYAVSVYCPRRMPVEMKRHATYEEAKAAAEQFVIEVRLGVHDDKLTWEHWEQLCCR